SSLIPPPPAPTPFPYTTLFRSGRQRAGAGPAGADGHADGGQLVLGLDDGEGPPVVGAGPVLLEIFLGVLGQAARRGDRVPAQDRSEEHTSELQSQSNLVCRLLL